MALTGAGLGTPAVAAGYTGPGDIVSGALMWGGLRGYTAAYAAPGTNPAIDIVDQAGANPLTVAILANGNLDVASISTWVAAHGVTTICVKKLYDQSGNANHWTQATVATMPTLDLSAFGSLPGLLFTAANAPILNGTSRISQAQPYSASIVSKKTTTGVSTFLFAFTAATNIFAQQSTTAGNISIAAGTTVSVNTAADNTPHTFQLVFNGASSKIVIDGSANTVNAGAAAIANISPNSLGRAFSQSHQGYLNEFGIWPSDISSSLNANQRAYWGF